MRIWRYYTVWKVSIFRGFLVRIQVEYGKIRMEKTPNTDTFHTVLLVVKQMEEQLWRLQRTQQQYKVLENPKTKTKGKKLIFSEIKQDSAQQNKYRTKKLVITRQTLKTGPFSIDFSKKVADDVTAFHYLCSV